MTPVTHFKLGLFAIAAIGALAAAAFVLGVHARRAKSVEYHVWFDESVQGLDVGAAVKYRGVPIGEVGRIDVAGDGIHIDTTLAIDARATERVHLDELGALRAELSTQGLTGVKFIDLDFVDAAEIAAEPAEPPRPSRLRSRVSFTRRLELQADHLARSLPAAVDDLRTTIHDVDGMVVDARGDHLSSRLGSVFDRAGAVLEQIHQLAPRVSGVAAGMQHLGDDADAAIADLRRAVAGLGGDDGLVASARRATEAAGDLGRRTASASDDLQRTLHDIAGAAQAVRELVDEIDRDPDMLVKGRAPSRRP